MGRAKEIIIKVLPARLANSFIRRHHYSGKVVTKSQLHFGVFLDGSLHGVAQFGPSLDKSKIIGLVPGTKWNEFIELNRLAFDEYLPKNSESRAISIMIKLIKKNTPHIKWILSFADGTQCGDGTIYRAAGFKLIGIKKNTDLFKCEDGQIIHSMTIKSSKRLREKYGTWKAALYAEHGKFEPVPGFQLKYIYLIDKSCKLAVPELPFSEIKKAGAQMYKGQKPN